MGRKESVEKGALKGGFLEEGESIEVAIPANGGKLIGLGLDAAYSKRFVLAATENHFYVFNMGAIGFKSVKGVAAKMPIGEVEIDKSFAEFKVNRRGHPDDSASFQLPIAVSGGELVRFIEARSNA